MARGNEWRIARDCDKFFEARGWHVEKTVGNRYQKGLPDRYLMHKQHGQRWVDYKAPGAYSFTMAQRKKWPLWDTYGVGVWIITGSTLAEYRKLFEPANWRSYWKERFGVLPDVREMLATLDGEDRYGLCDETGSRSDGERPSATG